MKLRLLIIKDSNENAIIFFNTMELNVKLLVICVCIFIEIYLTKFNFNFYQTCKNMITYLLINFIAAYSYYAKCFKPGRLHKGFNKLDN